MKKIALTQGFFARVDDDDYKTLSKHKWFVIVRGDKKYAVRATKKGGVHNVIFMHRQIFGFPDERINYEDGDTLNNTRENLRFCTHSQHCANSKMYDSNTSGYRGVTKVKNKYFVAQIKGKHIGLFHTPELAARAYDQKAKELFGEFANLNFPNE